jgi:hypothetical protein
LFAFLGARKGEKCNAFPFLSAIGGLRCTAASITSPAFSGCENDPGRYAELDRSTKVHALRGKVEYLPNIIGNKMKEYGRKDAALLPPPYPTRYDGEYDELHEKVDYRPW